MAAIDQAAVQAFVDAGNNAATTTEQGQALESLICYLFSLVPGIAVTHRNEMNVFDTEEIDVALFNDGSADGLFFLPNIILIEAKNWSSNVSSIEVSWFLQKLASRGLDFGILVTTKGVTGNAADLTNAHNIVAQALAQRRKLIVLTTNEILAQADTSDLVKLIKTKLCELAVKGTVG